MNKVVQFLNARAQADWLKEAQIDMHCLYQNICGVEVRKGISISNCATSSVHVTEVSCCVATSLTFECCK